MVLFSHFTVELPQVSLSHVSASARRLTEQNPDLRLPSNGRILRHGHLGGSLPFMGDNAQAARVLLRLQEQLPWEFED